MEEWKRGRKKWVGIGKPGIRWFGSGECEETKGGMWGL